MSGVTHRVEQGEMIDEICHRHYGTEDMVEPVYEANPGLARFGPFPPMGTVIALPEMEMRTVQRRIRLWG